MTNEELEEVINDCPTLYHMAEDGSWRSILANGLLSTTALLDRYQIAGERRLQIEERRRAESIPLQRDGMPVAVVRDQLPMDDTGLLRCLPPHLAPCDWYRLLNSKVFFWLTRDRLLRLLNAGAYRTRPHDVLEIDTAELVNAHRPRIWFCPINSGCTKPFPHPRDESTFLRIEDYPYADWRKKRGRGERVVELAVDYEVHDIEKFVIRITSMLGGVERHRLYQRENR